MNLIRCQHGLWTMLSTAGGAQDTLVKESIGSLSDQVAGELGGRVRTGHRVTAIVQDDAGVTVQTAHDHPGYLDGAIEAGLRAAAEISASR
jgi:monoamine oxidase